MKKHRRLIYKSVAVLMGIGAVFTLLPWFGPGSDSILGYKALCPFSPISTVLLFYGAMMAEGHLKRMKKTIEI